MLFCSSREASFWFFNVVIWIFFSVKNDLGSWNVGLLSLKSFWSDLLMISSRFVCEPLFSFCSVTFLMAFNACKFIGFLRSPSACSKGWDLYPYFSAALFYFFNISSFALKGESMSYFWKLRNWLDTWLVAAFFLKPPLRLVLCCSKTSCICWFYRMMWLSLSACWFRISPSRKAFSIFCSLL